MIRKYCLFRSSLFAALLCGVAAASALAQDPAASPAPGVPGPLTTPPSLLPMSSPPPPPPPMQRAARPDPLFDALDTNHDGVISAEEIANASVSLKTLLKNGSDHLTRDDLRPAGQPPRPKIGLIRPHGPPVREEEEAPVPPEARRTHRLVPSDDQPDEGSARPYFRRDAINDFRRDLRRDEGEAVGEFRHDFRRDEEAMNDDREPRFHRERPANDERRFHPEDSDQAAPPRDGREDRPFRHASGPENADDAHNASARPPGAMNEEADSTAPHCHRPPTPLFDALDTNHDGTISAEEIANAPAALKALLKNGHNGLNRDDLRPPGPLPGDR